MALTALGIAGIGAGIQALTGLGQALFAGKKQAEPKYEIPKEVFEATEIARGMAATGMPEASRMQALQGAQQSALFSSRNLANLGRGAALQGAGNIQAQLDRSALSVASQDAAMRQQNMMNYQRALLNQAAEQKLKFQTDYTSYQSKELQRRANVGAGLQNIMRGVDMFGSVAMMGALGGGGLGSGRRPGFGGSTYKPQSQFLGGGTQQVFSSQYQANPAYMSLYSGAQPFSGFSLLNTPIP